LTGAVQCPLNIRGLISGALFSMILR
jgi:hypothetical protein